MPKILTVELTAEQQAEVQRRLAGRDPSRSERQRLEWFRLLGSGLIVPQVADPLECNQVTVRDAVNRFSDGQGDTPADTPLPPPLGVAVEMPCAGTLLPAATWTWPDHPSLGSWCVQLSRGVGVVAEIHVISM
ncbi:hypothetical protein AB5J56_39990 [Streptomyces sp. R21]|uniref:Helix-turn-helix domain-containing protein n=1 Tax=Streptomyces sp. R21 TaxID=3238627 RepID=A0AB39PNC6_9ACTN